MLVVCAACHRHTRGESCAFCGAPVQGAESVRLSRGSRAALFASIAAVGLACGARTDLGGEREASVADAAEECLPSVTVYGGPFCPSSADAGTVQDVTVAPPYGLPPDE